MAHLADFKEYWPQMRNYTTLCTFYVIFSNKQQVSVAPQSTSQSFEALADTGELALAFFATTSVAKRLLLGSLKAPCLLLRSSKLTEGFALRYCICSY